MIVVFVNHLVPGAARMQRHVTDSPRAGMIVVFVNHLVPGRKNCNHRTDGLRRIG
jgi:hypothetical protein